MPDGSTRWALPRFRSWRSYVPAPEEPGLGNTVDTPPMRRTSAVNSTHPNGSFRIKVPDTSATAGTARAENAATQTGTSSSILNHSQNANATPISVL